MSVEGEGDGLVDQVIATFRELVDQPGHVQISVASESAAALSDEDLDRALRATDAMSLAYRGEKGARQRGKAGAEATSAGPIRRARRGKES
jgi:hypothetical protein